MNISVKLVALLIIGMILIIFHAPFSRQLYSALPQTLEREWRAKRTGRVFLIIGTLLVVFSLLDMFLPGFLS